MTAKKITPTDPQTLPAVTTGHDSDKTTERKTAGASASRRKSARKTAGINSGR